MGAERNSNGVGAQAVDGEVLGDEVGSVELDRDVVPLSALGSPVFVLVAVLLTVGVLVRAVLWRKHHLKDTTE